MGTENSFQFYSTDESLFSHDINVRKLWILDVTENSSKDFRTVLAFNRDSETLKTFITSNITKGNNWLNDGWNGHVWINARDSSYLPFGHIHGHNDFGIWLESTCHIEAVWAQLKIEIKSSYKIIPSFNLLFFIKEAKCKTKSKNLTYNEKSDVFSQCILLLSFWEMLTL